MEDSLELAAQYPACDINWADYLGLNHTYGTVDCIKLIQLFYKQELGVSFDIPSYSTSRRWMRELSPKAIDECILKYAIKVKLTDVKNYDLIVFKSSSDNTIIHFGMYISLYKMLHVEEHNVSKIEPLTDYWLDNIHGIYRHNSLV